MPKKTVIYFSGFMKLATLFSLFCWSKAQARKLFWLNQPFSTSFWLSGNCCLILLSGYAVLGIIYLLLFFTPAIGPTTLVGCLLLLGLYYAGTEGVLMAMVSAAVPPELRASGLAALASAIALGKMGSSLLFGWIWDAYGVPYAIAAFGAILMAALLIAGFSLRAIGRNYRHA